MGHGGRVARGVGSGRRAVGGFPKKFKSRSVLERRFRLLYLRLIKYRPNETDVPYLRSSTAVTSSRFCAHLFTLFKTPLPAPARRAHHLSWAPAHAKATGQPHYCVWVCVFTPVTHGARAAGSTRAWLLFRSLTPNATSRPPAQAALFFTPSLLRGPFPQLEVTFIRHL